MSLMREVPVTMLFANGRTSWFVFETDGIKRVDSLTDLLRSDASYDRVELKGGRWITSNGARVYIRNGKAIAGGGKWFEAQEMADPQGANKFVNQRWTSRKTRDYHFEKHAHEYGGDTRYYTRYGLNLIQKACDENIRGYVRADEQTIIRYDISNNDFAIGKVGEYGGLITLYKPKDGMAYFERQRRKDLRNGGKEV